MKAVIFVGIILCTLLVLSVTFIHDRPITEYKVLPYEVRCSYQHINGQIAPLPYTKEEKMFLVYKIALVEGCLNGHQ